MKVPVWVYSRALYFFHRAFIGYLPRVTVEHVVVFKHTVLKEQQEVKQKFPRSANPNVPTILAYSKVFDKC